MNLKIISPSKDRVGWFEAFVKPLLIAAKKNNAVDKWMFNLTEDGEINTGSVVYVSSKYKKIFIIEHIFKTMQTSSAQSPKVPYEYNEQLLGEETAKSLKKLEERQEMLKRQLFYKAGIRDKKVSVQLKDGSFETRLETWSANLKYFDISDGHFADKKMTIVSSTEIPNIEDLSNDLDFALWVQFAEKTERNVVPYQQISSKWKLNKEY